MLACLTFPGQDLNTEASSIMCTFILEKSGTLDRGTVIIPKGQISYSKMKYNDSDRYFSFFISHDKEIKEVNNILLQ